MCSALNSALSLEFVQSPLEPVLVAWLPSHVRSSTAWLFSVRRRSSPALPWNLLLLVPVFLQQSFLYTGERAGIVEEGFFKLHFCLQFFFFRGNWNEKFCCRNQDEMFWAYYLHPAFTSSSLLFFPRFHSDNCSSVGFFGNLVWRFSKYLHNSWASSSTEHVLNSFAQLEDGGSENLHPAGWWAYVSSSA